MTFHELIAVVADEASVSKADARAVLEALPGAIEYQVGYLKERLKWPSFGTFERRERAAREVVSSFAGDAMVSRMRPYSTIGFRAAKKLRRSR